jgi:hypothetical protein
MPEWKSFTDFGRELVGLEGDLTKDEVHKITRLMGKEAQKIAAKSASSELGGDRAFSGWRRGSPIPMDTQLRTARDGTLITPTKRSAGPWTVAEIGRNQGNASGFSGPGVNRSTGLTARTKSGAVRKVRARQARRWNGTTRPKHTASEAVRDMERSLPKIADKAVLVVTRKRFTVT